MADYSQRDDILFIISLVLMFPLALIIGNRIIDPSYQLPLLTLSIVLLLNVVNIGYILYRINLLSKPSFPFSIRIEKKS